MRANSAIGLAGEEWGPALGKDEPDRQWEGAWLEPMGSEEETQGLAILAWAAATLAGLPKATFNTQVEIRISSQRTMYLAGLSAIIEAFRGGSKS